jgi:hypothetical protein
MMRRSQHAINGDAIASLIDKGLLTAKRDASGDVVRRFGPSTGQMQVVWVATDSPLTRQAVGAADHGVLRPPPPTREEIEENRALFRAERAEDAERRARMTSPRSA